MDHPICPRNKIFLKQLLSLLKNYKQQEVLLLHAVTGALGKFTCRISAIQKQLFLRYRRKMKKKIQLFTQMDHPICPRNKIFVKQLLSLLKNYNQQEVLLLYAVIGAFGKFTCRISAIQKQLFSRYRGENMKKLTTF